MDPDLFTTTCPVQAEFERAVSALRDMSAAYQRIEPTPALARVAVPALVMSRDVRASLQSAETGIVFSGWVEHRPAAISMPMVRYRRVMAFASGAQRSWYSARAWRTIRRSGW